MNYNVDDMNNDYFLHDFNKGLIVIVRHIPSSKIKKPEIVK